MKRNIIIPGIVVIFSLACSLGGLSANNTQAIPQTDIPLQSEKRCGDGVCDGPENHGNCPDDCTTQSADDVPADTLATAPMENNTNSEFRLLYQLAEHTVSSFDMSGSSCYAFNFRQFLDGGIVRTDGSDNRILSLKDYPTSMVTAQADDRYFYISSPTNPVSEMFGTSMFNWNVSDQTLWAADFATQNTTSLATATDGRFPGGLATSPGNRFLIYLLTQSSSENADPTNGFMATNINPFISDSNLLIADLINGGEKTAVPNNTNRQLFSSFADFSLDGNSFYTLTREGESFRFVKVELTTGQVIGFEQVFPGFNWEQLNWDEFFPRENDFAYAHFTISPDENRLIAYKNIFTANQQDVCVTAASHHLWVFNLENNTTEKFENLPGYVSDADWKFDSSAFALALIGNAGCYPDYFDAQIDRFNKDGGDSLTLANEPKSKITNIGWSPDGRSIAYDVYGVDYIGRLKLIDVANQQISEVINTQSIGHEGTPTNPITLLFADWIPAE
ncbi:MAG: hypothetical protein H8E28_15790 [Anaerolineae bacterium]|nr:hypothetical protein [Anaerolineae bacterium]